MMTYLFSGGFETVIACFLILVSIYAWALFMYYRRMISIMDNQFDVFSERFWSGSPINTLIDQTKDQIQEMQIAQYVFHLSWRLFNQGKHSCVATRTQIAQQHCQRQTQRLNWPLMHLACIASNAVYIGLLGTVIGIIHTLDSIALSGRLGDLSVIAPGIAQALYSTALGLLVAIPAAIFYNDLGQRINTFVEKNQTFLPCIHRVMDTLDFDCHDETI